MRTLEEILNGIDLDAFLMRAASDPKFFINRVIGLEYPATWYQEEWFNAFLNNDRSCIIAPRGHGKCLTADTLIQMSDGTRKKITDIKRGDNVLSIDDSYKIVIDRVKHSMSNGIKDVYEIKTRTGRKIKCTSNHPFLLPGRWSSINDGLKIGNRIGIPRKTKCGSGCGISDDKIKIIAYLISEGSLGSTIKFSNSNNDIVYDMNKSLQSIGAELMPDGIDGYYIRNIKRSRKSNIKQFLSELGLLGKKSHDKFIPRFIIDNASERELFLLLEKLWVCDGTVYKCHHPEIAYTSKSKQLIDDIQHILLKLGINSKIRKKINRLNGKEFESYNLDIDGNENILHFILNVNLHNKPKTKEILDYILSIKSNPNCDTIDYEHCVSKLNMSRWMLRKNGIRFDNKYNVSRKKLKRIADVDKNEYLKNLASSDVYWDKIVDIEYMGKEDTYNLETEKYHNYIANDIITHNSEVLAVIFFLYIAIFKRDKYMIVVSKTMDMSKNLISRVKKYIEGNELLKTLRPEKAKLTWSKTEIQTTTGCVLQCRPYGQNIRSWHVHYCLVDEAAFYEDKSSFYYDIVPIVNTHKGHLMVISTPQSKVDLVAELQKKTMYWSKTYPAIIENEDGTKKPLWKDRFTMEDMKRMKEEQGEIKFSREYLCKVVSEGVATFPTNMIEKSCNDDLSFSSMGTEEDGVEYYFGADFAISAQGNYSVYSVIRKKDEKLRLVYMERPKRGTDPKDQVEMIKSIYNKFPIIDGYGDNGSFGSIIVNDAHDAGCNIRGFDFQSKKENLIINLRREFENGKLEIPTTLDDPYTKSMTDVLIKELSEIMPFKTKSGGETYKGVGAHDDTVMSLALAVAMAREFQNVDFMMEGIDEEELE